MEFLLMVICGLIFALVGGVLSRMCGGGRPRLPWGVDQFLYAIPYGLVGGLYGFAPAYAGAVLGKRTGHGQYLNYGYGARTNPNDDERLDFIVRFFFGVDNGGNYWRCFFGMVVTGMAVTLLPGIIACFALDPISGLVLAASGATKAVAYSIGHFVYRNLGIKKFYFTVIGEFLTGFFAYGVMSCLFF